MNAFDCALVWLIVGLFGVTVWAVVLWVAL